MVIKLLYVAFRHDPQSCTQSTLLRHMSKIDSSYTGRSVSEQIFACDEGVMGFHNDRRTGGNMPANDRLEVICSILLIYFFTFALKQARD